MTPQYRLLLCTDMDRTVIPNGLQPEHPEARNRFRAFCELPGVQLAYVTGRHREIVEDAVTEFALPAPDYVITDVGTRIYSVEANHWKELPDWQHRIAADWHGQSHDTLQQLLHDIDVMQLQELDKQARYKLSYYASAALEHEPLLDTITQRLRRQGVDAAVLWSIDEPNNLGLLDVIPRHGTKLHAIEYLQQHLGFADGEVLFAGDSGNDLPVLTSHVRSVLVNNASDDIKRIALQTVVANGNDASLYLAGPDCPLAMNGNYSAGVLQGVWHYAPQFRPLIAASTKTLRRGTTGNTGGGATQTDKPASERDQRNG